MDGLRQIIFVMAAIVFAGLFAVPLSPAAADRAWQTGEGPDPSNDGRSVAWLDYGVPETDDIQVRIACNAQESGAPQIDALFGASLGTLQNGAGTALNFSGSGFEHEVPGKAEGVGAEVGITGVKLDVGIDDPLWDALSAKDSLDYKVEGQDAASLPLKAGHRRIGNFVEACKSFVKEAAANTAEASDAAKSDGGISEKEAYEAAKELGTIEAWEAFLENFPKGFRADLARAYLKRIGTDGSGTAANDTSAGDKQTAVAPAPPPPADISLAMTTQGACTGGRNCSVTVTATNAGGEPFSGNLTIATSLAPGGAELQGTGTPPFSCEGVGGGAICSTGAASLAPGQSTAIPMTFTLPRNAGGQVTTCASIAWGGLPSGLSAADVQRKLNELGFDAGPVDGQPGRKTVDAIKDFQRSAGMQDTGELDLPLYIALFSEGGPGDADPLNDQACAGAAVTSAPPLPPAYQAPAGPSCPLGQIITSSGQCGCPSSVPIWTGQSCIPRVVRNCKGGTYYDRGQKLCLCPSSKPHWYNNRCHAEFDNCPGDSTRVGDKCLKSNDPGFAARGRGPGGGRGGCPANTTRLGNSCIAVNLAPLFNFGNNKPKGGGGGNNNQTFTGGGNRPNRPQGGGQTVTTQGAPAPGTGQLTDSQVRSQLLAHCNSLKVMSSSECKSKTANMANQVMGTTNRGDALFQAKALMTNQANQLKPGQNNAQTATGGGQTAAQQGKCPAGQTLIGADGGNTMRCVPSVAGKQCPYPGQVLVKGKVDACICTGGASLVGNKCINPAFQQKGGGQTVTQQGGVSKCPAGETLSSVWGCVKGAIPSCPAGGVHKITPDRRVVCDTTPVANTGQLTESQARAQLIAQCNASKTLSAAQCENQMSLAAKVVMGNPNPAAALQTMKANLANQLKAQQNNAQGATSPEPKIITKNSPLITFGGDDCHADQIRHSKGGKCVTGTCPRNSIRSSDGTCVYGPTPNTQQAAPQDANIKVICNGGQRSGDTCQCPAGQTSQHVTTRRTSAGVRSIIYKCTATTQQAAPPGKSLVVKDCPPGQTISINLKTKQRTCVPGVAGPPANTQPLATKGGALKCPAGEVASLWGCVKGPVPNCPPGVLHQVTADRRLVCDTAQAPQPNPKGLPQPCPKNHFWSNGKCQLANTVPTSPPQPPPIVKGAPPPPPAVKQVRPQPQPAQQPTHVVNCEGGQRAGNGCQCPGGQTAQKVSSRLGPDGSTVQNFRCIATGIQCGPGTQPQGNTCVSINKPGATTSKQILCPSNLVPQNGKCGCAPGLTWDGKVCAAPQQKRAAPPPPNQPAQPAQRQCPNGMVQLPSGQCGCPGGLEWRSGKCRKPKVNFNNVIKNLQQPQQNQQVQPQQNQQQQGLSPQQQQNINNAIKNLFSDRRLKRDVAQVTTLENGLKLYSFRYLWDDTAYVGVMAQDLLADPVRAQAVSLHESGYYMVDYGQLGLEMVALDEWRTAGR